jgi:predicted dehydrogenase
MAALTQALGDGLAPRERCALQTALLQAVHDLSILRALFGLELELVHALSAPDGWSLTGQLRLAGGLPCSYAIAEYGLVRGTRFDQGVVVAGEQGILRLAFDDPAHPERPTRVGIDGQPAEAFVNDVYLAEWRSFADAMATRHVGAGALGPAISDMDLLWRMALPRRTVD